MPRALYIWPLVFFLCPLSTRAGPLSTVSSLSPSLADVVPSCAHDCLQSFVTDNFPSTTCPTQSDLRCLCTHDSKSGLTIGEGALGCLASECSKNSTAIGEAVNIYEICQRIPNAKPMTHQTLTATHLVVTTVHNRVSYPSTSTMPEDYPSTPLAFPSNIYRPSSVSVSSTYDTPFPTGLITDTSVPTSFLTTTSTNPSTTSALIPISPTSSSVTSLETTTSPSASATAAAASQPQPALTKPQIAGVTVGSIAAAGLVFGLLALLFCLRDRKRKNRRSSDASFGNDKIVIDPPRTPSPPSAPAAQDVERGNREVGTPEGLKPYAQAAHPRRGSNRWSLWRKSMQPEDIGVAVAPSPSNPTHDNSPVTPMSFQSYETTSRLLPDKPTYSLYPPPLRLSSYNREVSPIDNPSPAAAGFALPLPGLAPRPVPNGRSTMDTSHSNLHLGPTIRSVSPDPFIDSTLNNRPTDPGPSQTMPTQRVRSTTSRPRVVQYGQWAEPVEIHRKPVPVHAVPETSRADPTVERVDWGADLPTQAASQAAGPSLSSAAPLLRRKSSGRRRFGGRRPMTFLSTTSGTSFEDSDSEDEPPLPQSYLSPVIESPPSRPRVAGVRYPVIPTSAAESPSINRTIREVRREQVELNPASNRSKGKGKASPKISSPPDKALPSLPNVPDVPELAGTELRERQQAPDGNNSGGRAKPVKPGSAKYKILVAPGSEGIENVGTPKSKSSAEWTPASTPTRRGR